MKTCDPNGATGSGTITSGWSQDINDTHSVICCTGAPRTIPPKVKVEVKAPGENVIIMTRVVMLNGKSVNMKVAAYN
jgi:hypothetical protein